MEYGLIGEKLGHSYSKTIHGLLADYAYELCPLGRDEFHAFMEQRDFKGINVTIPYKRDVLPYVDELDDVAAAIGSVNTIVNRNGRLHGYNTDYHGFLYTLARNGIVVRGRKVLVIGNGGSAQAVFKALRDLGADETIILKHKKEQSTVTYEEAARYHADADVIINTSPVGMFPNIQDSPMDLGPYKDNKLSAVVDLIFNPHVTTLLAQAGSLSMKAVGGLEMLVAQAKYAAERFLDTKINDDVIPEIYGKMLCNYE